MIVRLVNRFGEQLLVELPTPAHAAILDRLTVHGWQIYRLER